MALARDPCQAASRPADRAVKGSFATWHHASVKAIFCVPLLFASYALADEAADRVAIDRTIAALNEHPQRTTLFTQDADASSELARLPKARPLSPRALGPAADPEPLPRADQPTVTISKDPWGEVTINFPGTVSLRPVNIVGPRIVSGAIRFITSDVALADGAWTYDDGAVMRSVPLLFVTKREEDTWKLAALRVLAPR